MKSAPVSVWFDEDSIWVGLADGRVIGVPLAWFPPLLNADAGARETFELSPFGFHWEGLFEDISVAGLLAGRGDMGGVGKVALKVVRASTHPTLSMRQMARRPPACTSARPSRASCHWHAGEVGRGKQ